MGIGKIALGLLVAASSTQSAVLYQETFESRTNGDLNGQGGFTAMTQTDVQTGGLSYASGAVNVPGGSKNVTITGLPAGANNNYAFTNTFAPQSSTVYFAVAMTWTDQQADDFLYFALSDDFDSSPVVLGNSAGIVINGFGGTNAGQIGGRIRDNSFANTTQTSAGVIVGNSTSTPQYIVGSLSKVSSTNYNTLKLWVNPTSLTEGAATLTITRDMGISSGVDTFFFFSGAGNENNETMKFDNISIGTTYADVIAVPEPAAIGFLAASGLVMGRRRRF